MQNLSDISVIRSVLEKHGFNFSKALGQNFLINPSVCPRMAEYSLADENTGVIEIGAGIGVLTAELAEMGNHIITDTAEIGAGILDILLADRYRDVLVLNHRICARRLVEQHLIVFLAIFVKVIALERNED